jgi:hypothetical protein
MRLSTGFPCFATITGDRLHDVGLILDEHCLHRNPALGESAIRKLEESFSQPTCSN